MNQMQATGLKYYEVQPPSVRKRTATQPASTLISPVVVRKDLLRSSDALFQPVFVMEIAQDVLRFGLTLNVAICA